MNMISTGSFLTETGASNKQSELVKKLTAAWEKKNSKTARAGGASLMALSLAACGSEDNTPFAQSDIDAAVTAAVAPLNDAVAAAEAAQAAAEADAAEALVAQAAAEADAAAALVAQAAAEADAAAALVAQAAAEADAAAALVAQAAAEADAAAATVAQAAAEAEAAAATASAAEATAAKETAEAAQAAAEASLATAQADLTAKTAEYDALVASNATLQASYDALVAPTSIALTDDDAAGVGADIVSMTVSDDTITGTSTTYDATDVIADNSTTDNDTLTIIATGDVGATAQVINVENINFTLESFTATGTTADAIFEVAADNIQNFTVMNIDLNKVGSGISSATVTGLETGSSVTFSDDFTTAVIVDGDDNASLTATSKAASMTAQSTAGTLTGATMTSTSATAATMASDSDASVDFTTTAADMVIQAATATTVVASSAGSIDANTADLTAATSVTLTATDEVNVGLEAATTATISAGGTTASTIDDALGDTLTSVSLSGNGSAHEFSLLNSEGVSSVTITGDQNVTVTMDASDIDLLSSNAVTVVDNSSATSTLKVGTAAGDMDLTAAAVDVIDIAVSNASKTATVASGANVKFSIDQGATTIDGTNAGAASNTVTVTLDDGVTTANATVDIGTSLTFTDFASATIDVSQDTWASGTMTASSITALTGSADNTSVTIEAGSNGVTLATSANLGTGVLTINSSGAVALGGTDVTAGSLVAAGSGAVTATALDSGNVGSVTTGSGIDQLTFGTTDDTLSVTTNAGNDIITFSDNTVAAKTYTINGGDGSDTLIIGANSLDLNNGTAFTLTGIETLKAANGVTAVTVGASLLDGASFIVDHATLGDTFNATIELGTATSLDLSNLVINSANLTTADSFVVSAGASTSALTLTGADAIKANFTSGSGADNLTGGTGDDALTAGAGADTLSGGNGNDALNGQAGDDTINGGAGNDNITGGTGVDTMTGGAGNDTYDFDAAGEVGVGESIVEAASGGTDVINVDATVDFTNMTSASFDEIEQIDIADSITATFTGDQLTGETIELETATAGTATAMVVNVAFGATADLSSVTATANWTAGEDTITINGLGGNETITGTAENDTINLGAGADTVKVAFGGAGVDTITGFTAGAGGDVFDFTGATDVVNTGGNVDMDGFLLLATTGGAADHAIVDGITVLDNGTATVDDLGSMDAAGLVAELTDLADAGANNAVVFDDDGDVFYIAASDGTDTGIFKIEDAAAGSTTIATGDVTLIAILSGIADAGTLTADNFADFA